MSTITTRHLDEPRDRTDNAPDAPAGWLLVDHDASSYTIERTVEPFTLTVTVREFSATWEAASDDDAVTLSGSAATADECCQIAEQAVADERRHGAGE